MADIAIPAPDATGARANTLDHLALDAARKVMAVPKTKPVDRYQHQARVQVIVRDALEKVSPHPSADERNARLAKDVTPKLAADHG